MNKTIDNVNVNVNANIDKCISYYENHYGIAQYIYEMFKDIFVYKENENKWYYLDKVDKSNVSKLKMEIRTTIASQFILRSIYWNKHDTDENKLRSILLLKTANNLKNDKFIRAIIKEMKQFY